MSMSICIVGIIPPDTKWERMKLVWESCESAEIEIPEEVDLFFGGEYPDKKGVVMDLKNSPCCKAHTDNESEEGFEINIAKLPENVQIIRFYNSYQK